MPASVALSQHFEKFILAQVKSGRYNNVSEVVRTSLRLMEINRQMTRFGVKNYAQRLRQV